MAKRTVFLASATLMSAVLAFAQAPPAIGQVDDAPVAAAQPAPGSTTLSARGTIDRYDASSRTLWLSSANGTTQFPIASTTRIRQGGHDVDPSELQKLAGERATIRYTETDGRKIVESVHVFGK